MSWSALRSSAWTANGVRAFRRQPLSGGRTSRQWLFPLFTKQSFRARQSYPLPRRGYRTAFNKEDAMSSAQPLAGQAGAGAAGAKPGSRHLGLALVVIATAQLMVILDATIVNVALPDIQRALGFSGSGLEWVVNAYALTFDGLLLIGGRAGDILGRRRVFIAGVILFSAASLLGGFATSQAWLLGARALQGVGGAIVAPAALSLVATTFPEGRPRNRAMGVYAAMSIAGARRLRAAPRPVRPARGDHQHARPRRPGLRPFQRRHQPQRRRALA